MKRKFRFWTKTEDALLKGIYNSSANTKNTVERLKGKIDRTPGSIINRIHILFGKKRIPKEGMKAISLPEGFSFDLKPNRVVLHKNKVEVYF